MAKSALDWFVNKMEREPKQVQKRLAQLKITSAGNYHIRHGAEIMALSMGIKRVAHVPPDRLYQWSVKRYAKEARKSEGKPCPLELLAPLQLFSYGRDIVLKQLRGGTR
jgi:hypothetical protein